MKTCTTHHACDCLTEKVIKLEAENAKLREALGFYADVKNWGEIQPRSRDWYLIEGTEMIQFDSFEKNVIYPIINLLGGTMNKIFLMLFIPSTAFSWGAPKILEVSKRQKTFEISTIHPQKKGFQKLTIWAAKNFGDAKEAIQLKDSESGVLIAKGNLVCDVLKLGSGYAKGQRVHFTLQVTIEDKKAEIEFSDVVGKSDSEAYDDGARPSTEQEMTEVSSKCLQRTVDGISEALK